MLTSILKARRAARSAKPRGINSALLINIVAILGIHINETVLYNQHGHLIACESYRISTNHLSWVAKHNSGNSS